MCAPCSEPGNLRFGNQKSKNSYLVLINNHQKPDLPHFRVWQAKIKQLFKKANPVGQVKLSQWHSKIFVKWGLMEFRWANPNNTLLTFSMSLDSCPQCRGEAQDKGQGRGVTGALVDLYRVWPVSGLSIPWYWGDRTGVAVTVSSFTSTPLVSLLTHSQTLMFTYLHRFRIW